VNLACIRAEKNSEFSDKIEFVTADCNFVRHESVDRSYCSQMIIMALTGTINHYKNRDRHIKWDDKSIYFAPLIVSSMLQAVVQLLLSHLHIITCFEYFPELEVLQPSSSSMKAELTPLFALVKIKLSTKQI